MIKAFTGPGLTLWIGLVALLTALATGALLSLVPLQAAVLLLSLMLLAGVLTLPWPVLIGSWLAVVAFLVGPLQYAAGVNKAFWLPYLMGVLIGLRVVIESADPRMQEGVKRPSHPDPGLRLSILGLALLWGAAGVSSLGHRIGPLQALVGGKEYLFLWSVPAAFAWGLVRPTQLRGLWAAITTWLAVQALVVVWQRLVVAPRRGGDAPWDAVVGLFAGRAFGAGGSGTMAVVSLWAAAAVVIAWRAQRIGPYAAIGAGFSALLACALAEVKIAVLLLPILAIWVAWPFPSGQAGGAQQAKGRTGTPISHLLGPLLGVTAAAALSAMLLWAHQQQFSATGSQEAQSASRYAHTMLERNLQSADSADEHGQLTRLGAVQYWWRRQSVSDLPGLWVGHGIGSVRRSGLAPGALVQGLRFEPGRSTLVILLWETGLLGLLGWLLTAGGALWTAARLGHQPLTGEEQALRRSAAAIIALTVLTLPYGADLFEAPHLACAYLLGLGLIWGLSRSQREPQATGAT